MRAEGGECGGGGGLCGLEGTNEASTVVVMVSAGRSEVVSAGRRGQARGVWWW